MIFDITCVSAHVYTPMQYYIWLCVSYKDEFPSFDGTCDTPRGWRQSCIIIVCLLYTTLHMYTYDIHLPPVSHIIIHRDPHRINVCSLCTRATYVWVNCVGVEYTSIHFNLSLINPWHMFWIYLSTCGFTGVHVHQYCFIGQYKCTVDYALSLAYTLASLITHPSEHIHM